jgi:hypothetical protein
MQPSNTKRFLTDILDNIITQSIRAAKKKSQNLFEADESDSFGNDTAEDKEDKEAINTDNSKDDSEDKEKLKQGDINVDDIVDKLNAIRSGKSYKDEEILSKLTGYIDALNNAEKTALLTFLKALAQIVTGEIAAKDIIKPTDKPADIAMEKETAVKKRTITPLVIKKPELEDEKKKTPAEDTKGPVPIAAKKKG